MRSEPHVMTSQLVRPTQRGTLIIGHWRTGSHFVRDRCLEQAMALGVHAVAYPEMHAEDKSLLEFFGDCESDTRYHIAILNQQQLKMPIVQNPGLVSDWHVIRTVNHDLHRWFSSWFFYNFGEIYNRPQLAGYRIETARIDGRLVTFVGTPEQGHYYDSQSHRYKTSWEKNRGNYIDASRVDSLYEVETFHHGTQHMYYTRFLQEWPRDEEPRLIQSLWHALGNRMISSAVPADIEIRYQDMQGLSTKTGQWHANDMPMIDLAKVFRHHALLKQMLDQAAVCYHGLFKET